MLRRFNNRLLRPKKVKKVLCIETRIISIDIFAYHQHCTCVVDNGSSLFNVSKCFMLFFERGWTKADLKNFCWECSKESLDTEVMKKRRNFQY